MPSGGAAALRVAISTRASARRWAEVRASSSRRGRRPRRSLASAQSASKSWRSKRSSSSGDDGARDGVEGHLPEPEPGVARLEVDAALGPARFVGLVGALGVGQLLPVLEHPLEVLEAQLMGLGHQHRLVAGHGGLGAVPPGRGDGPGVLGPDLALPPGLGAHGQLAQRPPQADPAPGDRARQVTTRGDPGRRGLGPVGRPLLRRLEGGAGLGDKGLQARQRTVQGLDGGAVAVVPGPRRDGASSASPKSSSSTGPWKHAGVTDLRARRCLSASRNPRAQRNPHAHQGWQRADLSPTCFGARHRPRPDRDARVNTVMVVEFRPPPSHRVREPPGGSNDRSPVNGSVTCYHSVVLAADVYRPEQRSNFFLLVGTGAVTLTGLVFVAMSLNLKVIAVDATHRNRAINTLTGSRTGLHAVCARPHGSSGPSGNRRRAVRRLRHFGSRVRQGLCESHSDERWPQAVSHRWRQLGSFGRDDRCSSVLLRVPGRALYRGHIHGGQHVLHDHGSLVTGHGRFRTRDSTGVALRISRQAELVGLSVHRPHGERSATVAPSGYGPLRPVPPERIRQRSPAAPPMRPVPRRAGRGGPGSS